MENIKTAEVLLNFLEELKKKGHDLNKIKLYVNDCNGDIVKVSQIATHSSSHFNVKTESYPIIGLKFEYEED